MIDPDKINNSIRISIYDSSGHFVKHSVYDSVFESIYSSVRDSTRNSVWYPVWRSIKEITNSKNWK